MVHLSKFAGFPKESYCNVFKSKNKWDICPKSSIAQKLGRCRDRTFQPIRPSAPCHPGKDSTCLACHSIAHQDHTSTILIKRRLVSLFNLPMKCKYPLTYFSQPCIYFVSLKPNRELRFSRDFEARICASPLRNWDIEGARGGGLSQELLVYRNDVVS